MRRFQVAAALTLLLGLGSSTNAHAQIAYGYSIPAFGGVQTTETTYSPFGVQTATTYYSPFTGITAQTYGTYLTPFGRFYSGYFAPYMNVTGQSYSPVLSGTANYGYTPWYGYNPSAGYRYGNGTGVYRPNVYAAPAYGGYHYGWMRR